MKEQDLRDRFKTLDTVIISDCGDRQSCIPNGSMTENTLNQCVQIAIDYAREEAIGFSQWMHENTVKDAKFYTVILDVIWYNQTLEQCYEIYLTTKTQ